MTSKSCLGGDVTVNYYNLLSLCGWCEEQLCMYVVSELEKCIYISLIDKNGIDSGGASYMHFMFGILFLTLVCCSL